MLDALADQRLAAGQPDPVYATRDEDVGQRDDLLERQDIGARQEGHRLGHAVAAAEVAPVRDRQAHIGDAPAEAVDHRFCKNPALVHALAV